VGLVTIAPSIDVKDAETRFARAPAPAIEVGDPRVDEISAPDPDGALGLVVLAAGASLGV
jgi:hypothetical protein